MTDSQRSADAAAGTTLGRRHGSDYLLPTTFEERGTAVPFTTPTLAHARIRKDWRGRLELGIGQFSGGSGSYIVPWNAIRDMVALTSHDAMLHQYIAEQGATDPNAMRLAAIDVATSGLAGPELADAARLAQQADADSEAINQVMIVLRLAQEADEGDLMAELRDVRAGGVPARVQGALQQIARKIGQEPALLDQRVGDLGQRTHCVGMAWSPDPGRLRVILDRLRAFRDALLRWRLGQSNDAVEQAQFAASVATHTIDLAGGMIERFDEATQSIAELVKSWDTAFPDVTSVTGRLGWLLDGWGPIIDQWSDASTDGEQAGALAEITPVLPLVPRGEIPGGVETAFDTLARQSRRWVRANVDWRSGEVDVELVRRVELMRARAHEAGR